MHGTNMKIGTNLKYFRRWTFDFSKKSVESVSFGLQKYVQNAGTCVETWKRMAMYGLENGVRNIAT